MTDHGSPPGLMKDTEGGANAIKTFYLNFSMSKRSLVLRQCLPFRNAVMIILMATLVTYEHC